MDLEIENESIRSNPTAQEIEDALKILKGKNASFAILSKSESVYLQASGCSEDGISLEHREGSLSKHYYVDNIAFEDVLRAFQSYAAGETWSPKDWPWRQLKDRAKTSRSIRIKGEFSGWTIGYCVIIGVCMMTVWLGKRKGANPQIGRSVLIGSIAIGIALATTESLRTGVRGTRAHRITRSESPVRFWLGIVCGYALALITLIVILLSVWGVIP